VSILDVFMFILGASVAFAAVNTATTSFYRARMPDEPPVVVALGTSFSAVSISASAATVVGLGYLLAGWDAWLTASFAFTVTYLLLVGLELGLAARAHPRGGTSQ
jgi:small-conductance mechanosensitive channel